MISYSFIKMPRVLVKNKRVKVIKTKVCNTAQHVPKDDDTIDTILGVVFVFSLTPLSTKR